MQERAPRFAPFLQHGLRVGLTGRSAKISNHSARAAKAAFGVLDEMATDWVLSRRNVRLENKAPLAAEFVLRGLQATS